MKIAITIYENRVSPVLDTATCLLIIEFEDGREISRSTLTCVFYHPAELVRILREQGIKTLICGAVSRYFEEVLISEGIEMIPRLRGSVDTVIDAFLSKKLDGREFILPGCMGRNRRGGRCRVRDGRIGRNDRRGRGGRPGRGQRGGGGF